MVLCIMDFRHGSGMASLSSLTNVNNHDSLCPEECGSTAIYLNLNPVFSPFIKSETCLGSLFDKEGREGAVFYLPQQSNN